MNPSSSLMRIQLQTIIRSLGVNRESQTLRLNEVLERFYEKMSSDLMIGFFFTGRDLKHIAHQQGAFLMNAAGMSEKFEGKGPATAHIALPPILEGHFDRRLILLRETLQEQGIPLPIQELWISFESTFRAIVVKKAT